MTDTKTIIMKTKYLFLLFITVLLSSCEDVETPDLGLNSDWLQFENGSDTMTEGDGPQLVPVLYASTTNPDGIDVSFTYTSTVPDGFTVEPANGIVNIPAGEFEAYITVTADDDVTPTDDIVITFSIEGNTDYSLGIAGQGVYNVTSDLRIIEDDCPIEIEEFVGTYSVTEVFSAGGTNEGLTLADAFGESYQLDATLSTDSATTIVFNNSIGFDTYLTNGTTVTFITCTKEFIFDDGSTSPNLALFADFDYTTTAYSDSSKTLASTGTLGTYGDYELTLTKF